MLAENVWYIDKESLYIVSYTDGELSAPGTLYVKYDGYGRPSSFDLSSLTLEPVVPSQYHRALVAFMKARLSEDTGDYDSARYFNWVYTQEVKKAKKKLRSTRTGGVREYKVFDNLD